MCSMGASCVINAGPDGYLAQVIMVLGYDTRRPGRTCVGGAAPGPAPNDRLWHGVVSCDSQASDTVEGCLPMNCGSSLTRREAMLSVGTTMRITRWLLAYSQSRAASSWG